MSINVSHISKKFNDQYAVRDISFDIGSGEIVGFIGPNGAGKSTTMRIITGFLPSTSGTVKVNGFNISEHPGKIKQIIGYLPEHNPLYYEMYVPEYLKYVAGIYGLKGKSANVRIQEVIDLVGLKDEQYKKIGNLSKGYKQRVGISQALVHNPQVLILDEPTSGLDPNQIVEIRNLISTVGKEKTVMLSTHIMQEVEAICDRVIIIDNGEIKADESSHRISFHSKEQTIRIELTDPVEPATWHNIDGITGVRELPDNVYLLAIDHSEDIRPVIFNFAVKNNLTILSMTRQEKSLEEVFREITRKDKN